MGFLTLDKRTKELTKLTGTAAFTTKFVLEDNKVITYVTHDIEDGAWQFFSDDEFENFESVAKIVGLNEIMDKDPTLKTWNPDTLRQENSRVTSGQLKKRSEKNYLQQCAYAIAGARCCVVVFVS